MHHLLHVFGALALVAGTLAQNVTYCASGNVCFAVNIPATTASSGSGDIFLQISGPSTMSWIGLGQGSSMTDSNIFMVYANSAGDNVTVSPRLGTGHTQPETSGSTASVTLLSGSGISDGVMTANFKCSGCDSWSGGSMSFTDSSSSWIWAYKSGAAISSDSVDATLSVHSSYGDTTFNLQEAAGGSSANPFSTTSAAATPASSGSTSGDSGPPPYFTKVLIAHGVMACFGFAIFFPLGAIGIRLLSFEGLVFVHAGWMLFTYAIVLASLGMGVWIAVMTKKLDAMHSIIGLAAIGALLLQPITGIAHHLLYKRTGRSNGATYPHIWWGRAVVTLGIINGGLGLQLAGNTTTGEISYGVIAGTMWVVWMSVIVFAFLRNRSKHEGENGPGVFRLRDQNESRTGITRLESNQQYSPAHFQFGRDRDIAMSQQSTVVGDKWGGR